MEIVLVDNCSDDKTVDVAKSCWPDLKLVEITEYRPGAALNRGIENSAGDFLVCLSAHCPPVNNQWLKALRRNFDDPNIAGVYGRQIPTRTSLANDRRDLYLTFGLDKKIQTKDSFFHNANSMIRRDRWLETAFDESASNIEDRLWAHKILAQGYLLAYEPEAVVFHYHGIHQDGNRQRLEGVVRILESEIPEYAPGIHLEPLTPSKMAIAAMLPILGGSYGIDTHERLMKKLISDLKDCSYIDKIFLITDSEDIAQLFKDNGCEVPFVRQSSTDHHDLRADEVLANALEVLEETYIFDLIVSAGLNHPFRPPNFFSDLIETFITIECDTVIASYSESRPCWQVDPNGIRHSVLDRNLPRARRGEVLVGLPNVGSIMTPAIVRSRDRLAGVTELFILKDTLSGLEVASDSALDACEVLVTDEPIILAPEKSF